MNDHLIRQKADIQDSLMKLASGIYNEHHLSQKQAELVTLQRELVQLNQKFSGNTNMNSQE